MADTETFDAVFEQLKDVLGRHADALVVMTDNAKNYTLTTTKIGPNKKPLYFGAVMVMKSYVSYHLFPVYMYPSLIDTLSPALKKRMQGKSCFNFKVIDAATLAELADLTERGYEVMEQA